MGIRDWFSSVKAKVKAKLKQLPSLEQIIRERKIYARALVLVGDRVSAFEPDEVHILEYVMLAARAAQFASGGKLSGMEKLSLVLDEAREQWKRLGRLDEKFDQYWNGLARPALDAYAAEAKAANAWIPPA